MAPFHPDPRLTADEKFLEYDEYMIMLKYFRESASYDRMTEMMILFALVTGARYG